MVAQFPHIPADAIFIPGNTASSKNSKKWTGTKLIWSDLAREYRENTNFFWMAYRMKFKQLVNGRQKPLLIGMYFIRDSKRKFDWVNVVQIVQDLMHAHEWIEDDNITEMIPVPVMIDGKYFHVNKDDAGVYIIVI